MAKRFRRVRIVPTLHYLLRAASPGTGFLSTRLPGSGLRFYSKAPDVMSRHLAKYGEHEPDITSWLLHFLDDQKEPGIFVDIGANLGWFSVHAGTIESVSAILACEPDATNLWLLEQNLEVNNVKNAYVAPWAIGDRRGSLMLYRYKASNISRHSAVVDFGFGQRPVPMMSLDETLSLFGQADKPIHVIKIDVEGYEYSVLAGADEALKRAAAVVLEYSPELLRQADRGPKDVLDPLRNSGFTPFYATRMGELTPVNVDQLVAQTQQINLVWLKQTE